MSPLVRCEQPASGRSLLEDVEQDAGSRTLGDAQRVGRARLLQEESHEAVVGLELPFEVAPTAALAAHVDAEVLDHLDRIGERFVRGLECAERQVAAAGQRAPLPERFPVAGLAGQP